MEKTIEETPWISNGQVYNMPDDDGDANDSYYADYKPYHIDPADERTWLYCLIQTNTFERNKITGNIRRNQRGQAVDMTDDSWRGEEFGDAARRVGPEEEVYDKVVPLADLDHRSADTVIIVHKPVNDHTFSCKKTRMKFSPHPGLKDTLRKDELPWGDHMRTKWAYGYVKKRSDTSNSINKPGFFPLDFVHEVLTEKDIARKDPLLHHAVRGP